MMQSVVWYKQFEKTLWYINSPVRSSRNKYNQICDESKGWKNKHLFVNRFYYEQTEEFDIGCKSWIAITYTLLKHPDKLFLLSVSYLHPSISIVATKPSKLIRTKERMPFTPFSMTNQTLVQPVACRQRWFGGKLGTAVKIELTLKPIQ